MQSKIALITGAGSGIGRAVTLRLLADGFSVILSGRREHALTHTITLSNAPAERCLIVPGDVREPRYVADLFSMIENTFGRLDLLFNNAGIARHQPIEDTCFDDWADTLATNVTGPFLCTQAAFRIMKQQKPMGGRIINNGSLSAHTPRPNAAAYTTSKHAITGLTKSTALEGRPYNIACGQIDIGNALTHITAEMGSGVIQASGSFQEEPVIDVQHVAAAVSNMAHLPLDTNVLFMSIMATKMPFVGRG